VLIVDDHPMMRLGLRQFLTQEPDLSVCGELSNAAAALTAIERLKPDLVLLDIALEGRSGLDLLKDLRGRFPRIPILVHSMHDEAIFAERVLRGGARGYLMKQESGEKLVAAVRHVLRGEIYVSERLRMQKPKTARKRARAGETPIGRLSDREFEVFRLIGRGHINREIARELHISLKTVDAHREHIKRKRGLTNSTALNLMAVRWESEQAG
jgi:DNA-binding NarL/FixJ family response regulator